MRTVISYIVVDVYSFHIPYENFDIYQEYQKYTKVEET